MRKAGAALMALGLALSAGVRAEESVDMVSTPTASIVKISKAMQEAFYRVTVAYGVMESWKKGRCPLRAMDTVDRILAQSMDATFEGIRQELLMLRRKGSLVTLDQVQSVQGEVQSRADEVGVKSKPEWRDEISRVCGE